jgi:hypothetical protein
MWQKEEMIYAIIAKGFSNYSPEQLVVSLCGQSGHWKVCVVTSAVSSWCYNQMEPWSSLLHE